MRICVAFSTSSFSHNARASNTSLVFRKESVYLREEHTNLVHMEAIASSGLTEQEVSMALSIVTSALTENFGMHTITDNITLLKQNCPAIPPTVPGALGRVLLLSLNNVSDDWELYDERIEPFQEVISQKIDSLIGQEFDQPILVAIQPRFEMIHDSIQDVLKNIVQSGVDMYRLRSPMVETVNEEMAGGILPVQKIEIDGAMVTDINTREEYFDVSNILVFDDFIDDDLRGRLLDVINKRGESYNWDDSLGPDPKRWVRGGLSDIPDDNEEQECWGLCDEAINELCYEHNDAIEEVEQIICDLFADRFEVARLPEAVFGPYVSPLTANAPTHNDSFSYHIDADPNQTPPSIWTDIFGRYINRTRGKPRFISCLLYLNNEWNEELGAPTQFYDPGTNDIYQVFPKPGRCVIMDQDVTHKVVAPSKAAGLRPRYSLVWKLILHPKEENQNMSLYPEIKPIIIGSAKDKSKLNDIMQ
jgi:hypothetical protein